MENQKNTERDIDPIQKSSQISPEEAAMIRAKTERKQFVTAMTNGTLSCLPNKDGYADTTPVTNITNGTFYHGINMLLLKEHQKENGYSTAEYLTFDAIQKANTKLDLPFKETIKIKKGEKAFTISFKDIATNEPKTVKIFNIEQTTDPQKIKDYVAVIKYERKENQKAYFEEQNIKYKPYGKSQQEFTIECTSSEPAKYLGQYFAAVSSGAQFKVKPEIATEFVKNMNEKIFERNPEKPSINNPEGTINPFNLNIIGFNANKECKEFLKEVAETRKMEKKQEKKEMKQKVKSNRVDMEMGM